MSNKGVCRTAPATPGLLKSNWQFPQTSYGNFEVNTVNENLQRYKRVNIILFLDHSL